MVINIPSTKQTPSSSPSFLCRDKPEPTCVPIGVIARSAPILKRPMPRIKRTALTLKAISSVAEKLNHGSNDTRYTMAVIGNADTNASLIFDQSSFTDRFLPFCNFFYFSIFSTENQYLWRRIYKNFAPDF